MLALIMLIAHGPIGYLVAKATQSWWKFDAYPSYRWLWFGLAFIGGIFPDSDLFFYYFVDATLSHRQLISHSLLPYSVILLGAIIVWNYVPCWRLGAIGFGVFASGALSHIAADCLVGSAAILAPLSNQLYGLTSLPWYRASIFMRYQLVTNFSAEFLCIALAGYLVCRPQWRKYFIVISITMIVSGLGLIAYVNQHIYAPNGNWYYSDIDHDGITTAQDLDSDGDGLLNINDPDIDNDGVDNSMAMYLETFAMVGSLYDYTEGANLEIPLRLGLVDNTTLITRAFANVGIFFTIEMETDYYRHSGGYHGLPTEHPFVSDVNNWKTWFAHIGALRPASQPLNEFDILFFHSGHVGLLVRDAAGNNLVLEADASHLLTTTVALSDVEQREGRILWIGRLLPKPANKQY